jgi:hypothetical protein
MQLKSYNKPPQPVHVPGTTRGEELAINKGREPGRRIGRKSYRSARDSTSVNPDQRNPIDPDMPNIPPN